MRLFWPGCEGKQPYHYKFLVEAELALRLGQRAKEMGGVDGYCLQRYAEALEVIPYTLAENAALNPIEVVTNLRKLHNGGDKNAGINVRKVRNLKSVYAFETPKISII